LHRIFEALHFLEPLGPVYWHEGEKPLWKRFILPIGMKRVHGVFPNATELLHYRRST
jgi:hypothetical protein